MHFVPYYPPERIGGVGLFVSVLHQGLRRRGIESTVVTRGAAPSGDGVRRIARGRWGWFAGTLRDLYGEVPGTSSSSGPCVVIPLVDLRDESIKNLLSRELRGRREVRGLDLEVSDISVHVEGVDSTEWSRGRPNVDVTPGDYLEVRRVRVRAAGSETRGVRSDETEPGVD